MTIYKKVMIEKNTVYLSTMKKCYILSTEIRFLGILIYRHYNRRVTSEDEEFKNYRVIPQNQQLDK